LSREPFLGALTQPLSFLAFFLLGFLLAGRMADNERARTVQDAVAHSAVLLGVKPGLRESLDRCRGDLETVTKIAAAAEAHAKTAGAEFTDAQKEQWMAIQAGLSGTRERLTRLRDQYGLTPAETDETLRATAALLSDDPTLTPRMRAQTAERLQRMLRVGVQQGLFEQVDSPPAAASPGGQSEMLPAESPKSKDISKGKEGSDRKESPTTEKPK
jgi:hypothetical protein